MYENFIVVFMRMRAECIPCLLKRVLYEATLVDENKGEEVIINALEILSKEFKPGVSTIPTATKVHKRTYEILNDTDPYKNMKERSNKVALNLLPDAEKIVNESDNPFKSSIICSIVGNILDFGIGGIDYEPEYLTNSFHEIYSQGLEIDDSDKIAELLKKSQNILFFTDNCGEVVFDTLLCKELKKFDINLTMVVKGEPILTDATLEDAYKFGFDKIVDEIITTNMYAVGILFDKMDEKLSKKLDDADLIICKGMANYEAFCDTDYRPIAHLLRTKCWPIANDMGFKKDVNVCKLYE